MKIGCKCGAVIVDQTDFLSNKAYLIADQDWEYFADSTERTATVDIVLTSLI